MNNKILITEQQLKQGTTINDNVDANFLRSQIWYCQERFIKPLIGQDLYNEVVLQLSTSTLTSLNQTLLDTHIVPCLTNYAAAECLPLIHYRIDNIGIHNRSDSNFNPVTHADVEFLVTKFKNQGSFFAEQMTKYLFEHASDYPLFLNGNLTSDKIKPNGKGYRSAFYLGRKRNCTSGNCGN